MGSLPSILQDFTPGAYGIWSGVLMFAAWWLREWRETRKLSSADRLARREGYAKQVATLMGENRSQREDMTLLRSEYDTYRHTCQAETDQLRGEIRGLEDLVAGLKRRLDAQGSSKARLIAHPVNAPTTIARVRQQRAPKPKGAEQ